MKKIKVYEVTIKVFLKKDIELINLQNKLSNYMNMFLTKNEKYTDLHKSKEYKPYSFDNLYPLEKDKLYKKDNIYQFRFRTINSDLAMYVYDNIDDFTNEDIKGLTTDISIIKNNKIKTIFTLTPVIIKNDEGYWENIMDFDDFEKRIKDNLYKKYKYFINEDLEEQGFYSLIKIKSGPIKINYKDVSLLGDKLELEIKEDKLSQDLVYLALGVGIGENNASGFGFVGYQYFYPSKN